MITLHFHNEPVPQGEFDTNLVRCKIVRNHYSLDIGTLKGLPWEEIFLPKEMIEAPSELEIVYPNGQSAHLTRTQTEILKSAFQSPAVLEKAFIYDPIQHSVVIPAAFQLMQQFQGGVVVQVGQHLQFPHSDWIDSKAKLVSSSFSGKIENIFPILIESPRIVHEPASEYLSRFYSSIKQYMTQSPVGQPRLPHWQEIEMDLVGTSSLIQALELIVDESSRSVRVCVLDYQGVKSSDRPVQQAIHDLLDNRMRHLLPIDYHWRIRSFEKLSIEVVIEIDLQCAPDRFIRFRKDLIEQWIQLQVESTPALSQWNFDYQRSFENVPERVEFPRLNEIKEIKHWAYSTQTGEILTLENRKKGQVIDPTLKVKLNLISKESS
jgi:hypothetical protein